MDESGERETEASASCPHCGEPVDLVLDPGGAARQDYVEDCPVCCRPWLVSVAWDSGGNASVALRSEDEA